MPEEKISANESSSQILMKMDELQKKVNQINKNRRLSAIISISGIILVLIALGIFANNFISFVKYYDKASLIAELRTQAEAISSAPEAKQLLATLKDKLLPAYSSALVTRFEKSTPLLIKNFENAKKDIVAYLEYKMKPELENNLIEKLSTSEAAVFADRLSHDASKEKIANVLEASHKRLVNRIPDILNEKLDPALVQLNSLNVTFSSIYDNMVKAGEFKGITPEMVGEIENRLMENILELAIYQINPEKGSKKAIE